MTEPLTQRIRPAPNPSSPTPKPAVTLRTQTDRWVEVEGHDDTGIPTKVHLRPESIDQGDGRGIEDVSVLVAGSQFTWHGRIADLRAALEMVETVQP